MATDAHGNTILRSARVEIVAPGAHHGVTGVVRHVLARTVAGVHTLQITVNGGALVAVPANQVAVRRQCAAPDTADPRLRCTETALTGDRCPAHAAPIPLPERRTVTLSERTFAGTSHGINTNRGYVIGPVLVTVKVTQADGCKYTPNGLFRPTFSVLIDGVHQFGGPAGHLDSDGLPRLCTAVAIGTEITDAA